MTKQEEHKDLRLQTTIAEELSTTYREYARYTAFDRAIPHLMDGMKTTHRKIYFAALKYFKNKTDKVPVLAGRVFSDANYAHGDSSLFDAIVTMTQGHLLAMPYLKSKSNVGSIYSPNAAASRYVFLTLDNIVSTMLFKDYDLCPKHYDEGKEVEPLHYLPIIPTVLFNTTMGIAVGYQTNSQNRHPISVAEATLNELLGKKQKFLGNQLPPYVRGLKGVWVYQEHNNKYEHHGDWEVDRKKGKIMIKGIPYGFTYDSFEDNLIELCKSGYMKSFDNLSTDEDIRYLCHFDKQFLASQPDEKLYRKLQLFTRVQKDNFTIETPEGNIIRYEHEFDVIKDFVKHRLSFYQLRVQTQIDAIADDLLYMNELIRYINQVINKEIDVAAIKSKDALRQTLISNAYVKIDKLLELKVYRLTEDERAKAENEIIELEKLLAYYKQVNPADIYAEELKALIKQLKQLEW